MNTAFKKSIALHLVVFLLFLIDLPIFWHNKMTVGQVPIIVDLKDIKISQVTNLPPKAKIDKEDKAASVKQRKDEKNFAKEEPKEEPQPKEEVKKDDKTKEPEPEEVKEAPKDKKDFLVAPQPKKPTAPKKAEAKPIPPQKPKVEPKPDAKKKAKDEPKLANPLKSLLASVDQMEKNIKDQDQEATVKEGTPVTNLGVEGGTGGSYFSELSISEIDAIGGRLRACWNLDPGAQGIDNMVVEIRATLNQDGTVRKVDILDSSRYNSDPHFRSVADSARRAVYICAPYSILSEKYADKYNLWNTMKLRFNPLNKQIN